MSPSPHESWTRRTRSTPFGLLIHFREMSELKAKSRFTTTPTGQGTTGRKGVLHALVLRPIH